MARKKIILINSKITMEMFKTRLKIEHERDGVSVLIIDLTRKKLIQPFEVV